MYKQVLYSDPHFCKYSSILNSRGEVYSNRLHNLIKSLSWQEKLADENGCDEVICAGDMFHSPDLESEEITALQDVYFGNRKHIMLTGNHDSNVASLEYSSIKIFKSYNSEIITKPQMRIINGVEVYFIPYITENKSYRLSDYLSQSDRKKIVITHNCISGLQYGKFTSEIGFELSDIIRSCNLFINGHLHNSSFINEKIIIAGNLTGLNFNEDQSLYKHYAYILTISDSGEISVTPYINPYAYNFYKVKVIKQEDLHKLDNLDDNQVVSITCVQDLINTANQYISEKANIVQHRIVSCYEVTNDSGEVYDFTVGDHLKQFIEYVPTRITTNKILTEELQILGEG